MWWLFNGVSAFAIAHGIYVATRNNGDDRLTEGTTDFWDVTPYRIAAFALACLAGPFTWTAVAVMLVIAIIEFKSHLGAKMFNLRDVFTRVSNSTRDPR